MIARAWARLFGRAREQRSVDAIVRWHRAKLADARAQRDKLKVQRDRARDAHAELKSSLDTISTELAEVGGRFTALDYHASEADRRALAPHLSQRAAAGEALTAREGEILLDRVAPQFAPALPERRPPPADLAFATVASDLYLPGLEALLRSLKAVYPSLSNDVHVFHDGSLSEFARRRLLAIHAGCRFHEPDMAWLSRMPEASPNHRRVGRLGYMNVHALALSGYRRVVLLDCDLLVLDDISRLWEGERVIVCADCGERDYAVVSPFTGDVVFNSGVISLPAAMLGGDRLAGMQAIAATHAALPVCSTLDRFADQKAWNIYLKDTPKDLAPLNYNCNVRYLARSLDGHAEAVSILHFTGAKPWIDPAFLPEDLVAAAGAQAKSHPRFWLDTARRQLMADRLRQFRETLPARRAAARDPRATACRVLDADPARVPEREPGAERMAPAQFVLNGGDPDAVEHLLLGPRMLGGWNRQHPAIPASLLPRLRAARRAPALWAPFYFREAFEAAGTDDLEINYLLLEQPFHRYADQAGRYDPDPDGYLDDLRDEALTLAVPAALAMGLREIVAPPLRRGADDRTIAAARLLAESLAVRGVAWRRDELGQYAL